MQELAADRVGVPLGRRGYLQGLENPSDGGRADPVTELEKLALNALVPPGGVLGGEPLDQRGDLGTDRRPARPVRIGPLPGDEAAVPPQHSARRDQPVHPQPWGQEPAQRGEDRAIGPVQPGPGPGTAQHGNLVPQHQQLDVLGGRRAAKQNQPAAKPDEDQVEQAKRHGRSSSTTADRRRITAAHRTGPLLAPRRSRPSCPNRWLRRSAPPRTPRTSPRPTPRWTSRASRSHGSRSRQSLMARGAWTGLLRIPMPAAWVFRWP